MLSVLSGVIGGILLIIEGEWGLIFCLIIINLVAPLIMGFVLLPAFILDNFARKLFGNGYKLFSIFFSCLQFIYVGVVFAFWSSHIFIYVMNNTETFWGGILVSFGTALNPVFYMDIPSKNPDIRNPFFVHFLAVMSLFVMMNTAVHNESSLIVMDLVMSYIMVFFTIAAVFITLENL